MGKKPWTNKGMDREPTIYVTVFQISNVKNGLVIPELDLLSFASVCNLHNVKIYDL